MSEMNDRLTTLKERATQLGIKYSPNIGADALAIKIEEHISKLMIQTDKSLPQDIKDAILESAKAPVIDIPISKNTDNLNTMSIGQQRAMIVKNANKLVRCIVTNNNPDKAEWKGEIITACNQIVPKISKYIPFNEEWHIPQIILNCMQERQFRKAYTVKDGDKKYKKQKWMPEFTINILPPLTKEEFEAIRDRQLAQKKIGE